MSHSNSSVQSLNTKQQEAVTYDGKHLLLLAGARDG